MQFVDTHTHLYSEAFEEDREAVIQRAREAGISRFFLPAIDASYIASMKALRERYPEFISLMAGLHPTHVKADYEKELERVEAELEEGGYVAVGEIGIDLYWDQSTLADQIRAFRYQIGLAKKHNLPIVIHCREAFDEIFEVLDDEKDDRLFGIFHCFTGSEAQARRAISLNMKLGIGGVITFKNGGLDQFLQHIPLEHVVLETDAPYLSPAPFRGKRNESAYIRYVSRRLAEVYNTTEAEIAAITTQNAMAVFGC
ncbi:TatD family hydrolase [Robiginitalea aurantiaca]|uniref:TatD family hydrolase n=1 Tax=Robiginitalea aurantiaca TaxID=3056915 RepID=A0ABT7WBU2_9FLAO|nr:TatD family hydrolase [Robiginitalea aurantiaca]MDM9630380.1 TatD family hydrolase [Robiginitalea aurantiaca]